MKVYLLSFRRRPPGGVLYGVLNVRSPAPPVVALIGLLGILLGEQIIPVGRQMIAGTSIRTAWAADAGVGSTSSGRCRAAMRNAPLRRPSPIPGGAVMNLASTAADLILHNGRLTTLDRSNPTATAVAIQEGKFVRVGGDADVMSLGRVQLREPST